LIVNFASMNIWMMIANQLPTPPSAPARVTIPGDSIQVGDLVMLLSPWKEDMGIAKVVTHVFENLDINGIRRIYVGLDGEQRSWETEYIRVISSIKKNN